MPKNENAHKKIKRNEKMGLFETKISNYLRSKNKVLTVEGLRQALNIDSKYFYDIKRRAKANNWQAQFMIKYNEALNIISNQQLKKSLVKPEIIYQHWKLHFGKDQEQEDKEAINIKIKIEKPRDLKNE